MNIKITDPSICKKCNEKSCGYLSLGTISHNFFGLSTESSICPQSVIDSTGPSDEDLNRKEIHSRKGAKCILCGLCIKHCPHTNLVLSSYDEPADFGELSQVELKAVTSSYLSLLFGFSANSNRNSSLPFDAYVITRTNEEAFVQIDFLDDSLESIRRVLGNIILYSESHPISNGILVLSHLPDKSSHNAISLVQKIHAFPRTEKITIYMVTFELLRLLCVKRNLRFGKLSDILFNCLTEDLDGYNKRISSLLDVKTGA